jgi:hypothetical protein
MRVFSVRARRGRVAVAGVLVTALVAAGAAVAEGGFGFGFFSHTSTLVSATFYANTSVRTATATCTAANGDPIDITVATFTGTATSTTAGLNGPLTISVKTDYDTKTNAGSLSGEFIVGATSAPPTFEGRLEAVDSNGAVQGFLEGNAGQGSALLGSVTTTYSASGFSSASSQGTIGSGTGTDTAIVTGQGCTPPFGKGDQGEDQDSGQGNGHGSFFDFTRGGHQGHNG